MKHKLSRLILIGPRPMTPNTLSMLSHQTSALSRELSQEISALVEDFRARKPGIRDHEIDAGIALARQQLRGSSARTQLVLAGAMAALVAGLAIALSFS